MNHWTKKTAIQVLLLLVVLALLLYLLQESRQRTRQLNNTLKDLSTGTRSSTK